MIGSVTEVWAQQFLSPGALKAKELYHCSIDGYWPKQYDATWDYGTGITDTIRLLNRVPWYSYGQNGYINAGKAGLWTTIPASNVTYYNGLSGAALASHVLGQVQYELSNHLGNVQATVSDKRFVKTTPGAANSGPGLSYNTRTGFAASLPAVYDYYPFGQPIKERTVRYTATQTTYMTQLVQVPNVGNYSSVPNQNGLLLNAHNASLVPGSNGSVWVYGNSGTWGKNITGLTPNSAVSMSVSVGYVALAPVTISVSETVNGVTTTLASVSGNSAASYLLSFTPTGSQVQVSVGLNHSLASAGNLVSVTAINYSQQSGSVAVPLLVAVSSKGDDKYEFGFNGKIKDNEIAGTGNSQDYGMRMYNPRIASFTSIDPFTRKYPELTPYQFASNRPIQCIDLDGLEAYFNNSGSFVKWGPDQSPTAPVILVTNDRTIQTSLTVENLKTRVYWLSGEGAGEKTSDYYAHTIKNARTYGYNGEGFSEQQVYAALWKDGTYTSKDFLTGLPNEKGYSTYRNAFPKKDNFNSWDDPMKIRAKAILNADAGLTKDPTNGATNWGGGSASYQYNVRHMGAANVISISENGGIHNFFNLNTGKLNGLAGMRTKEAKHDPPPNTNPHGGCYRNGAPGQGRLF